MNHTHQSVDTLLRSVTPPTFINERHQDALRVRLTASEPEEAGVTRFTFGSRFTKMAAAGASAMVLVAALALGSSLLTARTVWAQVISAMGRVDTAIVTFRFLPPDGETAPPDVAAEHKAYVQAPNRYAVISPGRKAWINGTDLQVYDVELEQVTRTTMPIDAVGQLAGMFSSDRFPYRLFAPQYDHESDRGVARFEGRATRFIELWDSRDPTEKLEFYLDPDTLLPVAQITSHRDDAHGAWYPMLRADYAFNVPVDPQVFVPDYPATAKVVYEEPPKTDRKAEDEAQRAAWQTSALAIAWHGDKYVAVTDVWMGEAGWIGIKIRSNLFTVMQYPLDVHGLPAFIQDPVNQRRWDADGPTLRRFLGGEQMSDDEGLTYRISAGATRSPHNRVLGDKEFSQFYRPDPTQADVVYPKLLSLRILANVADKGRGESWEHYQDWKAEPEKYQLFELTLPAPVPSNTPPAGFTKEWYLMWWARNNVDAKALADLVLAMKDAGEGAEAYALLHEVPQQSLLYLGADWLSLLDEFGEEEEKKAFFDLYVPYTAQVWGENAEERSDLKQCREIMGRSSQQ